jgi:hypothetical protein
MVPVRTHWGKRGKSRIDSVPGRQSGTATPPTAHQHMPPLQPPPFLTQLIRLWTRKKGGHRSGFSSCFTPVYKGPGPYLHQTAAGVPGRGPASAYESVSPRSALLHRKASWAHTRQASCVLTDARRLSTAPMSPPPPRHLSRLPSYTGCPSASAATDARVERLRGPRDAGAAQRGDDGCLTALLSHDAGLVGSEGERASELTPINGTYRWAIRFGPPASLVGCDGGWDMQGGDTEVGEETVRWLAG